MLPKYVRCVTAKGKKYYYFDTGKRLEGRKVYAPLPSPRSADFGGRYAALLGHRKRGHVAEVLRLPKLIDLYERSPGYRGLSDASQKLYGIYLRKMEKLLPTAPASEITRGDIRKLVDGMAEKPGAANAFLATARSLFAWALNREYVTVNPCDGIEPFKLGTHDPWPDHVLAAALASDDASVRLLTHLLYFTALRLSDAVALRWSDIQGNRLAARHTKNDRDLSIPMHHDLAKELAARPRDGLIICTIDGRPIKAAAARDKLQKFTKAMGVATVPHGLRKNAVIALLEAGCSTAETAAISGQSLQMVELYARKRNQSKLADAAILRWEQNRGVQNR